MFNDRIPPPPPAYTTMKKYKVHNKSNKYKQIKKIWNIIQLS